MFVHLRTHSYYSFLSGLPSPVELARAAAERGMPALALTDTNNLAGAVEFYEACREAGVRPILGMELDLMAPAELAGLQARVMAGRDSPARANLALLATDLNGWANLCRLSSAANGLPQAAPHPGLTFKQLAEHAQGLICLAGSGPGRTMSRVQEQAARAYLQRLAELYPGRLYIDLPVQAAGEAEQLARLVTLAGDLQLPLVATGTVYYLSGEQAARQRLVTAIRLNRPLQETPPEACAPADSHFVDPEEMVARFAAYPQAVRNAGLVAERCLLELPLGVPHYPHIPLPPGVSALQLLRQKAQAGARELYGDLAPNLESRLEHELEVIGERGYAPLFLIMQEIVEYARKNGIPISSRGSAASSLVAHCLRITSPDPVRLNLYFERFLNPARHTPPDIDTDLCSRRRDEVIRYVYERYGAERVAMVCTINRFRPRSALREAAKAHGLPGSEVKSLADSLPRRGWGPPGSDSRGVSPYATLAAHFPEPQYQAIFAAAEGLIGLPRHLSIHPGGVVIAPSTLTDLVPTQMAAKGVLITQFDLEAIERFGLVKIDLLGIRGLTVLGDVSKAIQESQARTIRLNSTSPLDALDAIPEDDALTSALVQTGGTIGCFQIESPGMRSTLKEIQASSVDDIMAALALYRPGPLTGGLKDAFVRRHKRLEEVSHLHPALTSLLEDTFGVILYQEQVLRIAHELGGLNLAEADLLRRAMSHFDPGKQMQTLKEKFIAGALQHSGVPPEVGERVWELMAAFSGYGFPKAHAASYAVVAWRAAWCKAHYPAVFMAAVLANWGGYYSQRVYLMEARRRGLVLRPPHVNYSRREFSVVHQEGQPVLYMGLDQVRDLTRHTQDSILRGRPFRSLADLLARVDPRPLEAQNLVRVGGLEGLGSRAGMLRQLNHKSWQKGQLPLFAFDGPGSQGPAEEWSLADRVAEEEAVLGVSVIAHRLELVADKLAEAGALNTLECAARLGQRVRVAGMRQTWRRYGTPRGGVVYFMSLEDLEGMLDVLIGAEVYRRDRAALSGAGPYILEGTVELDGTKGEPFIRAERILRV